MRITYVIFFALITAACHSDAVDEKSWGSAQPIGFSGDSSSVPRIAMDRYGNAFVTWMRIDQTSAYVDVNRFSINTGWESALNLDQRPLVSAQRPEIGVSEEGNAIILLGFYNGTDENGLFATRYQEGIGWSGLQTVEETGSQHLYSRPDLDSSGVAQAIWAQFDLVDNTVSVVNLYSSRFTPGAGWSISELVEPMQDLVGVPQVALDSAGNAIAVWAHRLEDGVERIFSSRYVTGQSWGPTQQISSQPNAAQHPQIVIDSKGNAAVVWIQWDDSDTGVSLYMNEYRAGVGWLNDLRIGQAAGQISAPQLDVGSDDSFSVIWTDLKEQPDSGGVAIDILSSHRPVGQGWSEPATVDVLDGRPSNLDLASDPTGGAIAVWSQGDGGSNKIFASRFSSHLGWTMPQMINSQDSPGLDAIQPQIAIDDNGNAIVVWLQGESFGANIYANRFE